MVCEVEKNGGELEKEWYGLSHTNSSQNNNSNYNNNEHLLSICQVPVIARSFTDIDVVLLAATWVRQYYFPNVPSSIHSFCLFPSHLISPLPHFLFPLSLSLFL